MQYGVKLLYPFPNFPSLNFGIRYCNFFISSNTVLGMWLLIHSGIKEQGNVSTEIHILEYFISRYSFGNFVMFWAASRSQASVDTSSEDIWHTAEMKSTYDCDDNYTRWRRSTMNYCITPQDITIISLTLCVLWDVGVPDNKVHGANMGSTWAPCWPHEPCYQG